MGVILTVLATITKHQADIVLAKCFARLWKNAFAQNLINVNKLLERAPIRNNRADDGEENPSLSFYTFYTENIGGGMFSPNVAPLHIVQLQQINSMGEIHQLV